MELLPQKPPIMKEKAFHRLQTLDPKRDAYGFAVRPQHLQRYKDYANIFEEEEEERSNNWKAFLEQQAKLADPCSSEEDENETLQVEVSDKILGSSSENVGDGKSTDLCTPEKEDKDISHVEVSDQTLLTVSERAGEVESLSSSEEDDKERVHVEVIGEIVDSALEKVGETQLADLCSSLEEDKDILQVADSKQTYRAASQNIGEAETAGLPSSKKDDKEDLQADAGDQVLDATLERIEEKDDPSKKPASNVLSENRLDKKFQSSKYLKVDKTKKWASTRPALHAIENMMSFRVKKSKAMEVTQPISSDGELPPLGLARPSNEIYEAGMEPELHIDEVSRENIKTSAQVKSLIQRAEPHFPWEEELESLVLGGVPKNLRGELWQAFVGAKKRRKTMERYYQDLLAMDFNSANGQMLDESPDAPNKWKKQIEKDIPRTFPGHPALDEHGRNSLRRLLIAYARHNPAVGYCQAMNFFAGLLLLLMPEENAFWTLVGIMDDYFDGYFTEEMIESQVDQLVFEELVRERFPKLVNHLDYLGVQVAWISGPWFLSIFINMLPWESVLRVWDVLLFEGNRLMLFRTALALMELYGPAIATTQDAGDAITLLQSLAGSTFDSSQLVLTACMGFLTVTEEKLQELRDKHRPSILNVIDERTRASRVWKDSKGLAAKLYSFKHPPRKLEETKHTGETDSGSDGSYSESPSAATGVDGELDSMPDPQEQVVWLKVELCRVLEEKRFATLRAEELETALMEMVKQDNRLQLSARIEQLEQEITDLKQALDDKLEQEAAMVQVLMRIEQEHKLTEDARASAEDDAAAQRYVVHMLQEKYENAMASLAQMEKRAVMAESMLDATLQSESESASSPRVAPPQAPSKKFTLVKPFVQIGLGWRERNKAKPTNKDKSSSNEGAKSTPLNKEIINHEQDHSLQS